MKHNNKFSHCPACGADIAVLRAIERVKKKLTRTAKGCLEYKGTKRRGYGAVRVDRNRVVGVHRLLWIDAHGPIPEGLFVCHHCDNRMCANVDHLFLGTNEENTADKVQKGRQARGASIWKNRKSARGTKHGRAKLSEADVLAIRDESTPYDECAAKYGVSPSLIRQIRKGEVWTHLLH